MGFEQTEQVRRCSSANSIPAVTHTLARIQSKQTISFKSVKLFHPPIRRDARTHLVAAAAVLRGQYEGWQVAWQIQPFEVPHQVPEDDGVLVHNAWRRHGLVALVHQQALQLLPQDQRAQVGHRRGSRGRCAAALVALWSSGGRRRLFVCHAVAFSGGAEGWKHRADLIKDAVGRKLHQQTIYCNSRNST